MKKRFPEAQIVGFLREADARIPVKDLCRKHGFSDASYYLWRSKFGGMSVSDAKRLNELEIENDRLKKLLADALLENEVTVRCCELARGRNLNKFADLLGNRGIRRAVPPPRCFEPAIRQRFQPRARPTPSPNERECSCRRLQALRENRVQSRSRDRAAIPLRIAEPNRKL